MAVALIFGFYVVELRLSSEISCTASYPDEDASSTSNRGKGPFPHRTTHHGRPQLAERLAWWPRVLEQPKGSDASDTSSPVATGA